MNLYLKTILYSAAGLSCATGQIRLPDVPQNSGIHPLRVHNTWTIFFHPSFGFELPIPPGVSATGIPESESAPEFQSADRYFVMSAWGGLARDLPTTVIAEQWDSVQRKANRVITFQRREKTWFVVSGTDIRGMEFYEKFTMRGQHVAFLEITFHKSRLRQYEPWVEQIENGFRPVPLEDGPPEFTDQLSRDRGRVVIDETPGIQRPATRMGNIAPVPKQESNLTKLAPKKLPDIKVNSTPDRWPSADKVIGKPGFVYSPFTADHRMVDVVDMPSGTKAKCPYTMKIFRVP